jgi:hypothetical protein
MTSIDIEPVRDPFGQALAGEPAMMWSCMHDPVIQLGFGLTRLSLTG